MVRIAVLCYYSFRPDSNLCFDLTYSYGSALFLGIDVYLFLRRRGGAKVHGQTGLGHGRIGLHGFANDPYSGHICIHVLLR